MSFEWNVVVSRQIARGKPEMIDRSSLPVRLRVDRLDIEIHASRLEVGRAAARNVASEMRAVLREKDLVRMIFAAAPSQEELLSGLSAVPDLDWGRVVAFQMDEYVGLAADAPECFAQFLRQHLYDNIRPAKVYTLNGQAKDLEAERGRYAALVSEAPIDIVCAGIGENGHIAFNDPPVADFSDVEAVKVVNLDSRSREQQVNDGCFSELEAVPRRALTLTIPTLMSARAIFCVVPGPTKAEAVRDMLLGPVSTDCPATILRQHRSAVLYLDTDSAELFLSESRPMG